jgi:hypothetical protein
MHLKYCFYIYGAAINVYKYVAKFLKMAVAVNYLGLKVRTAAAFDDTLSVSHIEFLFIQVVFPDGNSNSKMQHFQRKSLQPDNICLVRLNISQ